jgi:hypothetical protein
MYLQWSSTRFFFIDLSEIQEGHDWQENEKIIIFFSQIMNLIEPNHPYKIFIFVLIGNPRWLTMHDKFN